MRSPLPPIDFSMKPWRHRRRHHRRQSWPLFLQIRLAIFTSFLIGISLTLMLCGSVNFTKFVTMPWVPILVMFLYFKWISLE
ncbi:hypothetical protein PHJA_000656900 [Phtheirospermum japonicum]|uniref:Uncharacterized protein n=1 Tax=Phtheirospermum japonicum TaxID=374723 RepID=A0A830BST4_9LAMI|nr:hypothetical protein PHJA_000656900 [Phtheirospermum japonicum]